MPAAAAGGAGVGGCEQEFPDLCANGGLIGGIGAALRAAAAFGDADRYSCVRPLAARVCGLALLVYEALSYECMRP